MPASGSFKPIAFGSALVLVALVAGVSPPLAQAVDRDALQSTPACPPDVKGVPPTVGGPPTDNLTDRLADSKGVICPPAGLDSEIHQVPPAGGELRVIPPPETPERRPRTEPK